MQRLPRLPDLKSFNAWSVLKSSFGPLERDARHRRRSFGLSAVAFAKPNPVDRPRVAFAYADINMGSCRHKMLRYDLRVPRKRASLIPIGA
jgi:hypothetical protein